VREAFGPEDGSGRAAVAAAPPVSGPLESIMSASRRVRAKRASHVVAFASTRRSMSVGTPDDFYERLLRLEEAVRGLAGDERKRVAVTLAVARLRRLLTRRDHPKAELTLSGQVTLDDAFLRGPR
jgi:hypothetical protein